MVVAFDKWSNICGQYTRFMDLSWLCIIHTKHILLTTSSFISASLELLFFWLKLKYNIIKKSTILWNIYLSSLVSLLGTPVYLRDYSQSSGSKWMGLGIWTRSRKINGKERWFWFKDFQRGCWCQTEWSEYFRNCCSPGIFPQICL